MAKNESLSATIMRHRHIVAGAGDRFPTPRIDRVMAQRRLELFHTLRSCVALGVLTPDGLELLAEYEAEANHEAEKQD